MDDCPPGLRVIFDFLLMMSKAPKSQPWAIDMLIHHVHVLKETKNAKVEAIRGDATVDTMALAKQLKAYWQKIKDMNDIHPFKDFYILDGAEGGSFKNVGRTGGADVLLVPPENRPKIKRRYQPFFHDVLDHSVSMFLALVQDNEYQMRLIENSAAERCKAVVLRFTEGRDDTYLAVLRVHDTFAARLDEKTGLEIYFNINKQEHGPWTVRILEQSPLPFIGGRDIPCFIGRPRQPVSEEENGEMRAPYEPEGLATASDGHEVVLMPGNPEHIFDLSNLASANTEQAKRYCRDDANVNMVTVRLVHSDKQYRKQVRGLYELNPLDVTADDPGKPRAVLFSNFLLGQNYHRLSSHDLFKDVPSDMIDRVATSLNAEQQVALRSLRAYPDGMAMMTGTPGSGKTHVIIAALQILLKCNVRCMVVCSSNENGDSFAVRAQQVLQSNGVDVRIVRAYALETEQHFVANVSGSGPQAPIRYYPAQPGDINPDCLLDARVQQVFAKSFQTTNATRDKRFRLADMSLAGMALHACGMGSLMNKIERFDRTGWARRASADPTVAESSEAGEPSGTSAKDPLNSSTVARTVPAEEGTRIESLDPNASFDVQPQSRYDKACEVAGDLLRQRMQGDPWTRENQNSFSESFKAIRGEIMSTASLVIATPYVAAQTYVKGSGSFGWVVMEECQHITPWAILPVLAGFPKAPYFMTGDPNQIGAVLMDDGPHNNEARVFNVNVLKREVDRGRPFTNLQYNHRSHPALVDLQNAVGFKGDQAIAQRSHDSFPLSQQFIDYCAEKEWPRPARTPILLFEKVGNEARVGHTHSSCNVEEATSVLNVAQDLIAHGFQAGDVIILTAYVGQARELRAQQEDFNSPVNQIQVTTVAKAQGQEAPIVLISLVRTTKQGFMAEKELWLTAISRPSDVLIIVGNFAALENSSSRVQSMLQRTIKWARDFDLVVQMTTTNLDSGEALARTKDRQAYTMEQEGQADDNGECCQGAG